MNDQVSEWRIASKVVIILGAIVMLVFMCQMVFIVGGTASNFRELQTRAKVSRVQSDLRSLATALQAYRNDFGMYPQYQDALTTPIAYITATFYDPFSGESREAFHCATGSRQRSPFGGTVEGCLGRERGA